MRGTGLPAALAIGLTVALVQPGAANEDFTERFQMAQRQSCKAVSSCYEAVVMWCSGYARADGDSDGIPCENVCPSREVVRNILSQLGSLAESSPICRRWIDR
jgi:hypothetical protein